MDDELADVVDGLGSSDCEIDAGVDVVAAVAVDEPAVFVSSADLALVPAGTAVAEFAGQSSTYVVCSPSESREAILVGKSRETPPCPFDTTEIVTVCVAPLVVDPSTEGAKISEVPATVMAGTEEAEDVVVELA